MKFKIKILVFVFIVPTVSFSQIFVGIKGGYNHTVLIDADKNSNHYRADFTQKQHPLVISALIGAQVSKRFQPSIEFDLSRISFDVNSVYGGKMQVYSAKCDYSLNYLNITFIPRFVFGGKVKFRLNPGLLYSFLVSSKVVDYKSEWNPENQSFDTIRSEESAKDDFFILSVGFVLGIGISYQINPHLSLVLDNYNSIYLYSPSDYPRFGGDCNFFITKISVGIIYKFKEGFFKKTRPNKPVTQPPKRIIGTAY